MAAIGGVEGYLSARHVLADGVNVNSLYQVRERLDGTVTPNRDRKEAVQVINMSAFNGMTADHFGGEFSGVLSITNAAEFRLVGDHLNGGLDAFLPEPGLIFRVK